MVGPLGGSMGRTISLSAFRALPEVPSLASSAGFGLEFTGLVDPLEYPPTFLGSVRSLPHFQLFSSAHGPFYDLMPASRDHEVAELARIKILRAVDACEVLGIGKIIFHSGWFPKTSPDDEWLGNARRFWEGILERAGSGTILCIENVYEDSPELLARLFGAISSERFRACLDIGHVNANSSHPLCEWVDALGTRIGHVHIHNNHGVEDEHNGLGDGTIDIPSSLALLSSRCPEASWNLEIRTELEESIGMIKSFAG